jgi:hypothetical protein
VLLQWRNFLQRFSTFGMMPVFKECLVLQIVPFQHCRESTFGELSLHDTTMNRYSLLGMEMRRSVIAILHPDHNTEESADFWHR